MDFEEQVALLGLWMDFLKSRHPSAALMREFYFDVVCYTPFYRYGMAPEVFDVLVNGAFQIADSDRWLGSPRAEGDHRAA